MQRHNTGIRYKYHRREKNTTVQIRCNLEQTIIQAKISVIEYLESEEFIVFSGGALDRHEAAVAEGDAADSVLEGSGAFEDGNRLRKCVFKAGETDAGAGANQSASIPGCYA
jgi:hypothetical protein